MMLVGGNATLFSHLRAELIGSERRPVFCRRPSKRKCDSLLAKCNRSRTCCKLVKLNAANLFISGGAAACMRQGVCILRFGSHAARCDTALWTFTPMCTRSLQHALAAALLFWCARSISTPSLTAAALFSAPCTKFNRPP